MILLGIISSLMPVSVNAISLWERTNNDSTGYYAEMKGLNVGDILTVIILENASASQKSVTQNSKSTSIAGTNGTGPLAAIKNIGLGTSSDFQGDGATTQTTKLSSSITARIMKVFPNGNMLIEGKKTSQINNETQEMFVKGVIRPVDISADNTVYSTSLADAEIKLSGHGSSSRTAKPGLINKVYDWIF